MTYMPTYTIILLYKYVRIDDPAVLMHSQRELCEKLGLKGRAIIAHEGINATFEGETASVEQYCTALRSDPRFADINIKKSPGTGASFPKLSVKVRREIVTLGLPAEKDIDPNVTTGKYLSAEELHSWFASGKKFKIIDMRNTYEHEVGHFKDSILPPLSNFRDLPKVLPTLEPLKDETIVTVCTGGVRCEKASGFLVKSGFKDVYQLKDGIVTYMEKFENASAQMSSDRERAQEGTTSTTHAPAKNFLGSLYVFDDRVTMAFAEAKQRPVVGRCALCATPSERYVNCANNLCHLHFIVCDTCMSEHMLCAACQSKRV
jgi:UPF0176 protein